MPDTTDPQPDRYRQRPNEVEAIQWTGDNADALRAFAGIDFATIDPADRIEDADCDAQLLVEASHWVGIKPGDWVLKFEGYFIAKDDVPFRAVWEPAASVPEVVGAEALARLLNGADVHIHDGHHPGWDSLAESGEEQYLGMARWLLKRLHVTERTTAAPADILCPDAFWTKQPHAPHDWQQRPDAAAVHCPGVGGEAQQPETRDDCNSGPGWYEVINPRNATTSIAYVHENGDLYLPEGDAGLTPDEFAFAAARGNAHRLVRADEQPAAVSQPGKEA